MPYVKELKNETVTNVVLQFGALTALKGYPSIGGVFKGIEKVLPMLCYTTPNKLNLMVPLFFLGNEDYLKAFDPHQLQVLAYVAIKAHGYGFGIGLIFFGFECIIDGYLIFTSGFLPKFLGVLILIAGLCYLTNSFALILFPAFSDFIFQIILTPTFIAELSMCLWLLIKGVDITKLNRLLNNNVQNSNFQQ